MKLIKFTFAIILFSININAQSKFLKGYFIDNFDQRKEVLIENIDWINVPIEFNYKLTDSEKINTNNIANIKEFGIYNIVKYIRSNIEIDKSSNNINNYSNNEEPEFVNRTLFLKVLVEGKNNLYLSEGEFSKKYFFSNEKNSIQQLIYKLYVDDSGKININDSFKGQLFENVSCKKTDIEKIKRLNYDNNSLTKYFISINECLGDKNSKEVSISKKQIINLSLVVLLNNSNLKTKLANSLSGEYAFENKLTLGFGFEAEMIFPFNNYNWSVFTEASYNSYKSNVISIYRPELLYPNYEIFAKFNYLQLPVGLRRYIYINKDTKINFDIMFNKMISTKSSIFLIDRVGDENSNPASTNGKRNIENFGLTYPFNNFTAGLGFQYKKFTLGYRFYPRIDLIPKKNSNDTFKFNYSSIILKYNVLKK